MIITKICFYFWHVAVNQPFFVALFLWELMAFPQGLRCGIRSGAAGVDILLMEEILQHMALQMVLY